MPTTARPHVHDHAHDHGHNHVHDHGHSHGHGHAHGHHGHSHAPASFGRAFAIGTTLNLVFVLVEAGYGFGAHSLSLVADAGHNLGDVLGLVLAWVASTLARRTPTKRRTYGLRRSSILAALANAILLLITVGGIGVEAVGRLLHPSAVHGQVMIWVAAAGIVINGVTAMMFISGHKEDLNLRAAFAHFLADALVSVGVVIAGIVILFTGWRWVDPAVSLVLAVVITVGTWHLLSQSINLAMDAVPESVDPHAVEQYLEGLDGVTEVHDLHIWGMSTTEVALTAHIVKPAAVGDDDDALLLGACKELHDRFGIEHTTIQIERGRGPHDCRHAPVGTL